MRSLFCSNDVIEAMVDAMVDPTAPGYDKDAFREALRSLVRLVQAEQMLSLQIDFNNLMSDPGLHH
ncbi:MAG: hypothetical protein V4632_08350 [Pseudomonadota bacterium]